VDQLKRQWFKLEKTKEKNTMTGPTGHQLSGHYHNQTFKVPQKKCMLLTQWLTNIEPILHLPKETEEQLSGLKLLHQEIKEKNTMTGPTGQPLSGHHHNQTFKEPLKKCMLLTHLLTNIELILHLPKETEELLSGLKLDHKETINQKEQIKELIN
jgi:hypothetical protein